MKPILSHWREWPVLTSPQNERIKGAVALRERRQKRTNQESFLVEGIRELRLAQRMKNSILRQVFVCEEILEKSSEGKGTLDLLPKAVSGFRVTRAVFNKIAMRQDHGGIIGICAQPSLDISSLELPMNPLVMIIEGVEKPGNLGALLRTADAAGVDAVIVTDGQLDIFNPNAIRASLGAVFAVPLGVGSNDETRNFCRFHKLKIHAATPIEPAEPYWKGDFRCGTAIVLGSEAFGLSNFWAENSDFRLQIPMAGAVDSLNLSVAGALMLFEARRQRQL